MRLLDIHQAVALLAKATGKFCMYINWDGDSLHNVFVTEEGKSILIKDVCVPSAPYVKYEEHHQIFFDGKAVVLCETEEEAWKYYHLTVGDDGPTDLNSYDGSIRTYALLCGPDGEMWTENT
jgi:hypothetical protein